MIDIPLIVCALSGLFYGVVWVLNKDMIWQTPRYNYHSYEAWFAANRPKGLWYAPLIAGLMWPHNYTKLSFDPVSDFFVIRIIVTIAAILIGLLAARALAP